MKILLAVDGSKCGRWATEWLLRIPFAAVPQVKALHVLDTTALTAFQPSLTDNRYLIKKEIVQVERRAEELRSDMIAFFAKSNVPAKVNVLRGATAATILKSSPRRGNLLIIGSRGLTPCEKFLVGGISTRVMNHAPCSVLVVKQPPRHINRVLLATDGSQTAERAVRFMLTRLTPVTSNGRLEVLVVNVLPFMKYAELREVGRAIVHNAAKRLQHAGYRIVERVEGGSAAEEILKIADQKKVDMIVTGAKGLGAVARVFLGSVSMKLVQYSGCSVLVVR